MGDRDLKFRTKEYALGIIRLFSELPKRTEVQILGRQLFRSGTSVGAKYREATPDKSTADFISKIEGSLQELEESEYWLELLAESGFSPEERLLALKKETGELKGISFSLVGSCSNGYYSRFVIRTPGPSRFRNSYFVKS
jgi:four helix bundle protein